MRGIGRLAHHSIIDVLTHLIARCILIKGLLDPRVLTNLAKSGALVGFVLKNGDHEVLEICGEIGTVNFVEVKLVLARHQQIKKVLILTSFLERENAMGHNK